MLNTELSNNRIIIPAPTKSWAAAPDLFEAQDFRKYLQKWLEWKKTIQPNYSGALFAKKAGLNSHTILGMVIRGERNLSSETIRAFSRALGIKGREAIYFEKLILFNQAKNPEDKSYYLDQLLSVSRGSGRTLLTKLRNHTEYLSHWYVVAIREMVALQDFNKNPEWIAQKLKKKITKKQAEEAWDLLINLGLVEYDSKNKRYKIINPALDIDPGSVDFAIRNYHKEFLDRAKDAIFEDLLVDRELSSLTLALPSEDLPKLREKIKDFRKQLNLEFPLSKTAPHHVVAINTQVLVLTEPKEKERESKKQ